MIILQDRNYGSVKHDFVKRAMVGSLCFHFSVFHAWGPGLWDDATGELVFDHDTDTGEKKQ